MILRQYLRFEPAVSASYLVGCTGKAVGAVINPVEPVEFYLQEAVHSGLKLRYVLDTHLHADHISTGRELARLCGAAYLLHRDSPANFDFSGVSEGDKLEIGNVEGQVLHIPPATLPNT
jgi:hydroxyacylglutathione hydrolase